MQLENLSELISLKLSGEASQEQLNALDQYLKDHPEAQLHVDQLVLIWKEAKVRVPVDSKAAFKSHIEKLNQDDTPKIAALLEGPPSRKVIDIRSKKMIRIATVAASVLLVLLSIFWFTNKKTVTPGAELNLVSTNYGSKKKLRLPDGTQVWLNSGSSLSYYKNFSKTHREVQLIGEAFFDVVEDKKRPFLIHTKLMDVRVLGTAFNVRSYPDEETSETALIRGLVQITLHQNPGETLFLRPNEKLIVSSSSQKQKGNETGGQTPRIILTQIHRLKQENTSIETSWVNNTLAFDNETLEQIALKLERWFDVNVIIKDEAL
ncbi:MAG TPA: FecR family protein, partial [Chitinophagaceae bacterium]|nr:FecR family protein [Chitinophagaceae bacterium]